MGTTRWAQPDAGTKGLPASVVDPGAPPTPPESIEELMRVFVDNANRGQFIAAQSGIYGARYGFFGANEWCRKFRVTNPFDIKLQSVSKPQIKGEHATVTVRYRLESRKNGKGEPLAAKAEREAGAREQKETLFLELVPYEPNHKIWQIVPPATEPKFVKGGPLLNFVVYKMAQKPLPKSSLGKESLQRMEALSIAVDLFRQDYEEQIAFAPEYLSEALTPYLKDPQSLFVPGTLDIYTFNANLSGRYYSGMVGGKSNVGVGEVSPEPPPLPYTPSEAYIPPEPYIKNLDKVVMFYEDHNQKTIFRYDGKAAICFADGHTALVTPEEARDLIWNPA